MLHNVEAMILNPKQVAAKINQVSIQECILICLQWKNNIHSQRFSLSVCWCVLPPSCVHSASLRPTGRAAGPHSESKQHDSQAFRGILHPRNYSPRVQQGHLPSASLLDGAHKKAAHGCQTCWCIQYVIEMLNFKCVTAITTRELCNPSLQEWRVV